MESLMKAIYKKYDNYELNPKVKIKGQDNGAFAGYISIVKEIKKDNKIIVCDLYPGADQAEILTGLAPINPSFIIDTQECLLSEEKLNEIFKDSLIEDRVFGVMTHKSIMDCFDLEKLEAAKKQVKDHKDDTVLVIGVGASLVTKGDVLLYFDMARWEIQLRYRKGMENWLCNNGGDPILSKYKRGFFIEWRIADRHKRQLFEEIDYLVDTNEKNSPKMITGEAFREGLKQTSHQPFRTQPYFDPGVWGGQWMKDVFGLNENQENYAWSFDGVPEENSLNLQYGNITVEIPCMDLTLYQPLALLGEKVYGRFGTEFPIRFDLLDTMGGGNLSLQVHPLTEYIQQKFGMNYTQDESYYILDAAEEAFVYLGVKEGIDLNELEKDLAKAQVENVSFDVEKYVNKIPVKKHDHVLIPAGTVHCSGSDTMVLEISATPYIFTFKLWDWGRIGMDGLPRPIHIEHGIKNIQLDRDTGWIEKNLIHQEVVCQESEGFLDEKTGLHQREFIETHRYTIIDEYICKMDDSVHVLNLVEGSCALVESMEGDFEPFEVHYAETFIIPASVGQYKIRSLNKETIRVVCAWVR